MVRQNLGGESPVRLKVQEVRLFTALYKSHKIHNCLLLTGSADIS